MEWLVKELYDNKGNIIFAKKIGGCTENINIFSTETYQRKGEDERVLFD